MKAESKHFPPKHNWQTQSDDKLLLREPRYLAVVGQEPGQLFATVLIVTGGEFYSVTAFSKELANSYAEDAYANLQSHKRAGAAWELPVWSVGHLPRGIPIRSAARPSSLGSWRCGLKGDVLTAVATNRGKFKAYVNGRRLRDTRLPGKLTPYATLDLAEDALDDFDSNHSAHFVLMP